MFTFVNHSFEIFSLYLQGIYLRVKHTIKTTSADTFLQNEDLSDNLNVTTEYTYIGSQVTDTRDEGPVTVSNGKSIIATRYGATIEGFFEVKPGASLEISTGQPITE